MGPCWGAGRRTRDMEHRERCSGDVNDCKGGASQDGDGGVGGNEGEGVPHLFRAATELMLADRPLRADGAVLC